MKYGSCECRTGCPCEGTPGPAALSVERDGVVMRVCTRCALSDDKNYVVLLQVGDDVSSFYEYDPLGLICVAGIVASDEIETEFN